MRICDVHKNARELPAGDQYDIRVREAIYEIRVKSQTTIDPKITDVCKEHTIDAIMDALTFEPLTIRDDKLEITVKRL